MQSQKHLFHSVQPCHGCRVFVIKGSEVKEAACLKQGTDSRAVHQALDSVTISAAAKHRLRGEMAKLVQQLLDEQKKAASASGEQASKAALEAVQQVHFPLPLLLLWQVVMLEPHQFWGPAS